MRILISEFGGEVPRLADRQLPQHAAVAAKNVKLFSRELESWNSPLFTFRSVRPGPIRTMFRMYSGDTDYWLTWNTDVDVERAPLAGDTSFLVYYTGDLDGQGWPKKTTRAMATGSSAYPADYFEMGVPPPSAGPTVTPPAGSDLTRSYFVTFVNSLGQEGPPSAITTVSGNAGTWALTNIATAPPSPYSASSKWGLAKRRVYRAYSTAAGDVDFYRVTEITDMSTTSYNDTVTDAVLVTNPRATTFEFLVSGSEWLPPPSNLRGLCKGPNGMAGGFYENVFCWSEPYHYDAWPQRYQKALPFPIVWVAAFNNGWIIYTKGVPYVVSGSNPLSLDFSPVENENMGAVSKTSGAVFPFGAVVGTNNGLAAVGAGVPENITRKFMTRDDWLLRAQPSNLRAAAWNDRYIGFFDGVNDTGIIFDPDVDQGPLSFLSIFAHAVYADPETNKLYISVEKEIYEFDGDENNAMNFDWTSKVFMLTKPTNFGAFQVDASYEVADNVNEEQAAAEEDLSLNEAIEDSLPAETYADGMAVELDALGCQVLGGFEEYGEADVDISPWGAGQYMTGSVYVGGNQSTFTDRSLTIQVYAFDYHTKSWKLHHNEQLTNGKPKRLPRGFVSDAWQIRLSGNIPVHRMVMANTMQELELT